MKITGTNVDICGSGLGLEYDSDNLLPLPPTGLALSVDGDHAVIHRNYINGPVVFSANASDSRLGDEINGSGDTDDGVRAASVTVLAATSIAAQRVTIRDPFPRALNGLAGNGISGGDDSANHANIWAQTPTILTAETSDNFATVHVTGIANPLSLVDIYFDNQITVARQTPVTADATGYFTFTGGLPSDNVTVIAVSTLIDPAHAHRVGSSSQYSNLVKVTAGITTTALLPAPNALTFSTVAGGSNPPAQYLFVKAPSAEPTLAWQTDVTTTDGLSWLAALPLASSGDGTITVTVNATGLMTGSYHGIVTVTDVVSPSNRATDDVFLFVEPAPPVLDKHVWLPVITR